jgi:hypothetical protein
MNTLIKTLAVSAALLSTQANAGLFDSAMTLDWVTANSEAYKLSAYGYDARVYEWTPLKNPNMSCIFVASNESSGAACYPKASHAE